MDFTESLGGVRMKMNSTVFGFFEMMSDFGNWLDGAKLVVGEHNRHEVDILRNFGRINRNRSGQLYNFAGLAR